MVITGHKTPAMALRYVNLKADDVVSMMHDEPLDADPSPAGYQVSTLAALQQPESYFEDDTQDPDAREGTSNVVHMKFGAWNSGSQSSQQSETFGQKR